MINYTFDFKIYECLPSENTDSYNDFCASKNPNAPYCGPTPCTYNMPSGTQNVNALQQEVDKGNPSHRRIQILPAITHSALRKIIILLPYRLFGLSERSEQLYIGKI